MAAEAPSVSGGGLLPGAGQALQGNQLSRDFPLRGTKQQASHWREVPGHG